jgi:hypothetical protein
MSAHCLEEPSKYCFSESNLVLSERPFLASVSSEITHFLVISWVAGTRSLWEDALISLPHLSYEWTALVQEELSFMAVNGHVFLVCPELQSSWAKTKSDNSFY